MLDFLNDPTVIAAGAAFVGTLIALAVPKLFSYLKALVLKTENTVDDAVVAKLEEIALSLLKAKTTQTQVVNEVSTKGGKTTTITTTDEVK